MVRGPSLQGHDAAGAKSRIIRCCACLTNFKQSAQRTEDGETRTRIQT